MGTRLAAATLLVLAVAGCDDEPVAERPFLNDVAYAHDRFIAVGSRGDVLDALLLTSADGRNWNRVPVDAHTRLLGVAHGNGRTLVVGGGPYDGDTASIVLVSTDGESWTRTEEPPPDALSSIAFGNDVFVGSSDAGLYVSSDGERWMGLSAEVGGTGRRIRFAGGQFFVMDQSSAYYTSTDGLEWTFHNLEHDFVLHWVAEDAEGVIGGFVYSGCMGEDPCDHRPPGGLARSTDGVEWPPDPEPIPGWPTGFATLGDFAALSTAGGVVVRNGLGWSVVEATRDTGNFTAIAAGPGEIVAVGRTLMVGSNRGWELAVPPLE